MPRGKPPLQTPIYNSGALCVGVENARRGGRPEGGQLTCPVFMLYKENVFVCYFCNL